MDQSAQNHPEPKPGDPLKSVTKLSFDPVTWTGQPKLTHMTSWSFPDLVQPELLSNLAPPVGIVQGEFDSAVAAITFSAEVRMAMESTPSAMGKSLGYWSQPGVFYNGYYKGFDNISHLLATLASDELMSLAINAAATLQNFCFENSDGDVEKIRDEFILSWQLMAGLKELLKTNLPPKSYTAGPGQLLVAAKFLSSPPPILSLLGTAVAYRRDLLYFYMNQHNLGVENLLTCPQQVVEDLLLANFGSHEPDYWEFLNPQQKRVYLRVLNSDPRLRFGCPEGTTLPQVGDALKDIAYRQGELKDLLAVGQLADAPAGWSFESEITGVAVHVGEGEELYDSGDCISFVLWNPLTQQIQQVMAADGFDGPQIVDPKVSPKAYKAAKMCIHPQNQVLPSGPMAGSKAALAEQVIKKIASDPEALPELQLSVSPSVESMPAVQNGSLGIVSIQLEGLPLSLLELLAWLVVDVPLTLARAQNFALDEGLEEFTQHVKELRYALLEYIKSGTHYGEDAVLWVDEGTGTVWPVPEGAQVLSTQSDVNVKGQPHVLPWLILGNGFGIQLNQGWSSSKPSILQDWQVSNPAKFKYVHVLASNIPPVSLEQAKKDGKDFGAYDWSVVVSAEQTSDLKKFTTNNSDLDKISAAQLVSMLQQATQAWITQPQFHAAIDEGNLYLLKEGITLLPPTVAKLAMYCLLVEDLDILDIIVYKLTLGHYGWLKKDAPYQVSNVAVTGPHTSTAYGIPQFITSSFTISEEPVSYHTPVSDDDDDDELPLHSVATDLVLTKTGTQLGGMHTKTVYTDQHGNEWMAKFYASDPQAPARVDAEHWANKIGQLFSFRQPETRIMTLEGVYSYVQFLAPAVGNVQEVNKLTFEQQAQILEEHVLDWLISNHDSTYQNLLIAAGTEDIIGIDKGQAWRFFGEDKLAVGYQPPTNPIPVFYDTLYKEWPKIPAYWRRNLTKRVLHKAIRVQEQYDVQFVAMVTSALEKRSSFPADFTSVKDMVDAVLARKKALYAQFWAFYQQLYAANDIHWDLGEPHMVWGHAHGVGKAHTTISKHLLEQIKLVAVHGKALFFDSADLEDQHILLYTEQLSDGQTVLRGEARLTADADVLVTNWLKTQTIHDHSTAKPAKPKLPPHAVLPGNDHWYSKMLALVKTVSHHAEDGEYNTDTLDAAYQAKSEMVEVLGKVLEFVDEHAPTVGEHVYTKPVYKGQKLVTAEQQDTWIKAVQYYLSAYDVCKKAMASQQKLSEVGFLLTKAIYAPSASALSAVYKNAPVEEAEQETQLTADSGKILSVVKSNNSGTLGSFDPKTGQLKHQADELTEGYVGYKYVITGLDHAVEYRPWTEKTVTISQRGLLRFVINPWNDSRTQLEDALDTLRIIGVDLQPATAQSMERYYYQHLRRVLHHRKDREHPPHTGAHAHLQQHWRPSLSIDKEISLLRETWAIHFTHKLHMPDSMKDVDWYPQFSRSRPHAWGIFCGKPYWLRPDTTLKDLFGYYGGGVPRHKLKDPAKLPALAASGGLWATEERLRMLGTFITGMSSEADQGTGGATSVFFRQNQSNANGEMYLHPRAVLRTSNYAYDGDHYGKTEDLAEHAYFDLAASCTFQAGSNELMIKHGVSILDDILAVVVANASHLSKILKFFKDQGINDIHGRPIEKVFVATHAEAKAEVVLFWKQQLA